MIRSMTGFGRAAAACPLGSLQAEVRCTNGRFFKLYPKLPPGFLALERRIEQLCREHVGRGSVDLFVRFDPSPDLVSETIDQDLAARYAEELNRLADRLQLPSRVTIDTLIALQGVISASELREDQIEQLWPTMQQVIGAALGKVARMQESEGQALTKALRELLDGAVAVLDKVKERYPQVADTYRERLRQRLADVLAESGIEVDPSDVLREAALFVERTDIAEEIERFRSHVAQFRTALDAGREVGKRLEFLAQELHREANTMGSKSSDATLSQHIVELKTLVERIREQVMNIE